MEVHHLLPWHEQAILQGMRYHGTGESYMTGTRQMLTNVHTKEMCAEQDHCVIHKPSMHNLVKAPTHWRIGYGIYLGDTIWEFGEIMERICPCGFFHPDPDDLAFKALDKGEVIATRLALHECCDHRCCGL